MLGREQKLPHEQSDYQVYQVLSQHIAKMLQSHPCVPLQTLMVCMLSIMAYLYLLYMFFAACSGVIPVAVC